MALYPSPDYQTSFELIGLLVQEKRFNIDCQDGGHGSHLRYPIRTIYAILIYKAPLYFQWSFESIGLLIHETFHNRFSTWLLGWPFWISDQNDFIYFWSTSHPDTSYLVLSQWPFGSGEEAPKQVFKMVAMVAIRLPIGMMLANFDLQTAPILPTKFWFNRPYWFWRRSAKNFQDGGHGSHLGFPIGMILAILDLQVSWYVY